MDSLWLPGPERLRIRAGVGGCEHPRLSERAFRVHASQALLGTKGLGY